MASSKFFKKQTDSRFFREQAEKCAELARRTFDEDCRERFEKLQRTYHHLAEMEDRQAGALNAPSGDTRRAGEPDAFIVGHLGILRNESKVSRVSAAVTDLRNYSRVSSADTEPINWHCRSMSAFGGKADITIASSANEPIFRRTGRWVT